jgi:hypothetical protein
MPMFRRNLSFAPSDMKMKTDSAKIWHLPTNINSVNTQKNKSSSYHENLKCHVAQVVMQFVSSRAQSNVFPENFHDWPSVCVPRNICSGCTTKCKETFEILQERCWTFRVTSVNECKQRETCDRLKGTETTTLCFLWDMGLSYMTFNCAS